MCSLVCPTVPCRLDIWLKWKTTVRFTICNAVSADFSWQTQGQRTVPGLPTASCRQNHIFLHKPGLTERKIGCVLSLSTGTLWIVRPGSPALPAWNKLISFTEGLNLDTFLPEHDLNGENWIPMHKVKHDLDHFAQLYFLWTHWNSFIRSKTLVYTWRMLKHFFFIKAKPVFT